MSPKKASTNENNVGKEHKIMIDAQTSPKSLKSLNSPNSQNSSKSPQKNNETNFVNGEVSPKNSRNNKSGSGKQKLARSPKREDQLSPIAIKDPESPNRYFVEKQFKRSPRPSIKHQHAILVSDENDIVSIKVSPHEDFDEDFHSKTTKMQETQEQTEENVEMLGGLRLDDRHKNNRSTSCLTYVPTDPWQKMNGSTDQKVPTKPIKSLSRPSLNDPDSIWVWREHHKDQQRENKDHKNNTLDDKKKSKKYRPKPIQIKTENVGNSSKSFRVRNSPPLSLSPTLGYHVVPDVQPNKKFLNISNPNLLQPRHSFSSLATTDSELPLNIRRLSEQMKYTNYFSSTSNTTTNLINNNNNGNSVEVVEIKRKTSAERKALLETTC